MKIGVDRPDVYRPRPKILLRENPEPVIFTLGFVLRVRGLHELLGIDEDVEAIARRRAIGETVTYEHVLVARRVARAHNSSGKSAEKAAPPAGATLRVAVRGSSRRR